MSHTGPSSTEITCFDFTFVIVRGFWRIQYSTRITFDEEGLREDVLGIGGQAVPYLYSPQPLLSLLFLLLSNEQVFKAKSINNQN